MIDRTQRTTALTRAGALVALLILWQAAAIATRRPILPPPTQVAAALASELPGALGRHLAASLYRVTASIALSITAAAPLGLALGQSRRLNHIAAPFIYILTPIPKVVLVPIVLLILGVGDLAKIAIITMILFFQILILVRDAAAGIRPELLTSVRSLGAGGRALFRFVYLPASIPAILTAVRQSIGTAVAVLYVAELVATRYGLGYYIYVQGSTLFNYPRMYAGVIAMSALGLALTYAVDTAERRLCTWCRRTE
jgi:NitT/TauT family transport system permease protein